MSSFKSATSSSSVEFSGDIDDDWDWLIKGDSGWVMKQDAKYGEMQGETNELVRLLPLPGSGVMGTSSTKL